MGVIKWSKYLLNYKRNNLSYWNTKIHLKDITRSSYSRSNRNNEPYRSKYDDINAFDEDIRRIWIRTGKYINIIKLNEVLYTGSDIVLRVSTNYLI